MPMFAFLWDRRTDDFKAFDPMKDQVSFTEHCRRVLHFEDWFVVARDEVYPPDEDGVTVAVTVSTVLLMASFTVAHKGRPKAFETAIGGRPWRRYYTPAAARAGHRAACKFVRSGLYEKENDNG